MSVSLSAPRARWWWAALTVGVVLSGCRQPDGGGDAGRDAGPMDCVGQVGCACDQGNVCQAGECVAGTCTDCKRGEDACVCRSNGTCNPGLRCGTGQLCEACPAGENGCACTAANTCNAGLACTNGSCSPDSCTAGMTGCPCRTGASACDGTAYCDGMNRCQTCTPEVAGCPCGANNMCSNGLACDAATTTCRAAKTCADLVAEGVCVAHQQCVEGQGTDATCAAMTCEAEFTWNPVSSTCVACQSPGCANEPLCTGDGGVLDTCDAQHRSCTEAPGGTFAYCSVCQPGFVEVGDGGTGACVASSQCGSVTCSLSEYCDTLNGPPTCQPLPCAPGKAIEVQPDGTMGACKTCTTGCTGVGQTGRYWPFTDRTQQCVCETTTGYFWPIGNTLRAAACDADHDGWVNENAWDTAQSADIALRANSRCDIRLVDRVRLKDEYGMAADVMSCTSALQIFTDGGTCASVIPLPLIETARNDGTALLGPRQPAYGAGDAGRTLDPSEVNALTKACVVLTGDYNDNQVDDIAETQSGTPGIDERARLKSFSYFTELADSYYLDAGTSGVLVIAERSRCDPSFPLHYAVSAGNAPQAPEPYLADAGADAGAMYWRSCSRRRDATFNAGTPKPSMDFAQWACPGSSGSCPMVPPPHPTLVAPYNPATTLMRNHGLCELGNALPADHVWRGMLHHSQFKCVAVTNGAPTQPYERLATTFATDSNTTGKLVYNGCAARPCSGPNDTSCRSPLGLGDQTRRPTVTCRATLPMGGQIGFAAIGYQPYVTTAAYVNGCVNEDLETAVPPSPPNAYATYLCPYPEYSQWPARADTSFGRYTCYGDLPNFLWSDNPPANPLPRAVLRWDGTPPNDLNGFWR